MAVAFGAADRERITAILLDTAEELFATHGLRKTSLDELVEPAEIAKSSFYAFFESKEALYLEVMLRRAPQIAERGAKVWSREPGRETLAELMRVMTDVWTTDPFYRRLLTHPDELRAVRRRVSEEDAARVHPVVVAPVIEFIRRGQHSGALVGTVEPEVVLGVIRTASLIVLHREEFGDDYEQVLDTTIQALATGLSKGKKGS
ncbi:TetR/AcrR family transcriptional regulator [Flindersiella endophytica]